MKKRKLGIVLISVLFFVLVAGLIGRVILSNGHTMAMMGAQAEDQLLAEKAAEAGAIYARVQIRNKAEWKGDLDQTTINLADMKVVEDRGNVVGWMQNASGQVSMFRIRFNYQDGPVGADGLDDPAHPMDLTYLSINNVRKGSDVPLPRAQGVAPWNVVDPSTGPSHAPRGSMVVEVEGLAGNKLNDLTGPGDTIPAKGHLTRRVLRVCYAVQAPPNIPTAAVSAGNGIEVESSSAVNVSVNGIGTATLRSKSNLEMKKSDGSPNIVNMNGKIGRDWSKNVIGSYAGSILEHDEHIGDGNDFFNLKWSDVPAASSSESKAVQIPGGVYVIQDDGHFKYYDMDLAAYKASVDPATGVSSSTGLDLDDKFTEVRSGSNMAVGGVEVKYQTVKFDKDVNVFESTGNKVKDITFTNPLGRRLQQDDSSKKYTFTTDDDAWVAGTVQLTDATLSGKGDVNILINVNGQNGAVTAEGNAVVAAPSVKLKKDSSLSQQRLSLYVKKDLTLSTFTSNPAYTSWFSSWYNGIWYSYTVPKYEGYGQLDLDGLIYSWGNTTVYAGTPGKAASGGNIRINGALVSYGANPTSTAPGSDGGGKVRLYANNLAEIVYDATKLVADPSILDESGPIKSVDRISYGFEN